MIRLLAVGASAGIHNYSCNWPPMPGCRLSSNETNRRDFLIGRSALRALNLAGEAALVDDRDRPAAPDEPGVYLLEVTRRAMACEFQVILNAARFPHGADAAIAAMELVEQLEQQMTVFRDSSEISRLNATASERPVRVERRLYALLKQAVALYEATEGAFDITSGPLTRIWGFMRRQGRMPSAQEVETARQRVGSCHLRLNDDDSTVAFAQPEMEINLGAIGKGYALDRCAEWLLSNGIGEFLLHGGNSSLLARGHCREEGGWLVGLRDPVRPERRIAEVRLLDRALGTSGTANQFFYYQGRRYGHIVDPRTGRPAQDLLGTTVLAPTGAEADAIATALFVMGREAALDFCDARPDLSAILIWSGARAGELHVTTVNLPDSDFQLS